MEYQCREAKVGRRRCQEVTVGSFWCKEHKLQQCEGFTRKKKKRCKVMVRLGHQYCI